MPNNDSTTYFGADISDLRKAMQDAKRSVALANSEFKEAAASCDDWSKSSDGLGAKLKQLNSNLKSQKTMLEVLEEEYRQTCESQGENSKAAENLKIKINNQKAAINQTVKEIGNFESNLEEVTEAEKKAAKTGKSVEETLKEMKDEAENAGDGFTVLKGAMATFIGNGLSALVGGIKNGISSIINLADETREYRTELAKMETAATTAGASADYIKGKWHDMGAVLGDEGAVAEGLNNLMAAGFTTEKEMDAITSHLEGAAIKWKDTLKFEGLADGLQETLATGKAVGPFSEMLERSGVNLEKFDAGLEKCKTSADKQNYVLQELEKLGLNGVSEAYRKQNEDLIANNKAQADYNDKLAQLGEKAEPVITTIKQGIGDLLGKFIELIEGVDMSAFTAKIEEGFAILTNDVIPAIKDGFQWILDNKDALITGLAAIAGGLAAFKTAQFISSAADAIKKFKKAQDAATVSQALLNAVMNANPLMLIVTIVGAVVAAIIAFVATNDDARAKLKKIWDSIVKFVKKAIDSIVKFFTKTIPDALSKMVDFFKELPGNIWTWLLNTINKVIEFRRNMIDKAKEIGLNFLKAIVEKLKEIPGKMLSIGKDIVKGIWNGINNAKQWILDKIKGFGKGILNGLKDFFGIKSPSRVMRDQVGKMITAGIAVGIDEGKSEVEKVLAEMNKELLESEKKYLDESERLKDSKSESDKKYLEGLKSVADKERKIYDAMQKDIENKKQSILDNFKTMADKIADSVEEIASAQEKIQSKLKDNFLTFDTVTLKNGEEVIKTYSKLADNGGDNAKLEEYYNILSELFNKRKSLPAEVMAALTEMSVDEGTSYAKALLNSTDEEFEKYVSNINKKGSWADKISKLLTKDQTSTLSDEVLSAMGKVPEELFGIGADSAEQFGAGFMQQLRETLAKVKLEIGGTLGAMLPAATVNQNAKQLTIPGTVNNFTQNIYAPQQPSQIDLYRSTKNLLNYAGGK